MDVLDGLDDVKVRGRDVWEDGGHSYCPSCMPHDIYIRISSLFFSLPPPCLLYFFHTFSQHEVSHQLGNDYSATKWRSPLVL